eukprot:XP_015578600.1 zinc finger A20 and AN1 domain-containing stress-associated protein 1 [Ricinus communis]
MESRKRIDPPHCVNGCDFNRSIKNCNLCSKSFREKEDIEIANEAIASSSMESLKQELKPRFFSSGDSTNANAIFGANSLFGACSRTSKKSCFSTDYNNAASGSIFKFTTLPEISVRNFTFGTSTVTNKRCNRCNKRVGLLGFGCKCGHLFCGKHRYPEEHKCRFDHKAFGHEVLRLQNPGLQSDKLHTRI